MGILDTASRIKSEEGLDALWIQVGAFMELHGDSALAMNKAYRLALWQRQGSPTVGVPVTHIEKWANRTAELGIKTGLAFQFGSGYKISREITTILPGSQGMPCFSKSADPSHLGQVAAIDHKLQVNEIFVTEVPGIFSTTRTYRRICDGNYCDHSSRVLVCIAVDAPESSTYLNKRAGSAISAIYPEAW